MTIVVGYSPSGQGVAAVRAAVRYAQRHEEDLLVASHLYNDPELGPTAASEASVREALDEAGAGDLPVTVRSCADSDIGDFLISASEEAAASLLVIGLRRKSPIGKLNLGASARKVVLGAPCPVLAVKDEHIAPGSTAHARV